MNALLRWPWMTMLLAIIVIISPLGQEVIHGAFFSGEALARSISLAMLYLGLAVLAVIAGVEWLVRLMISRRRARGAPTL